MEIKPPRQPRLSSSHDTRSSGDKTGEDAFVAMANLSPKLSTAPKAQHEPHFSWFLIGWMSPGHCALASNSSGISPSSMWSKVLTASPSFAPPPSLVPIKALASCKVLPWKKSDSPAVQVVWPRSSLCNLTWTGFKAISSSLT